jgi:hypothetical protein
VLAQRQAKFNRLQAEKGRTKAETEATLSAIAEYDASNSVTVSYKLAVPVHRPSTLGLLICALQFYFSAVGGMLVMLVPFASIYSCYV